MKILLICLILILITPLISHAYQTKDAYGNYVDSESEYTTRNAYGVMVNSKSDFTTRNAYGTMVNSQSDYPTKDRFGVLVQHEAEEEPDMLEQPSAHWNDEEVGFGEEDQDE